MAVECVQNAAKWTRDTIVVLKVDTNQPETKLFQNGQKLLEQWCVSSALIDPLGANLCTLCTSWPEVVSRWYATNNPSWIKISWSNAERGGKPRDLVKNVLLPQASSHPTTILINETIRSFLYKDGLSILKFRKDGGISEQPRWTRLVISCVKDWTVR